MGRVWGGPEGTGSGRDGRDREHEEGKPNGNNTDGVDDGKSRDIQRTVAERIHEAREAGCFHGSDSLGDWASDIVTPQRNLIGEMQRFFQDGIDFAIGGGGRSYVRTRHSIEPSFILPVDREPIPRISIIVDTSGSMSSSDFNKARSALETVLDGLPNRQGIRVVCGDTSAGSETEAFELSDIELRGGGGTNMGSLIEAEAERDDKPQLIMCITDGYTPWCDDVGIPTMVCLTRSESERDCCGDPPSWMHKYWIDE